MPRLYDNYASALFMFVSLFSFEVFNRRRHTRWLSFRLVRCSRLFLTPNAAHPKSMGPKMTKGAAFDAERVTRMRLGTCQVWAGPRLEAFNVPLKTQLLEVPTKALFFACAYSPKTSTCRHCVEREQRRRGGQHTSTDAHSTASCLRCCIENSFEPAMNPGHNGSPAWRARTQLSRCTST